MKESQKITFVWIHNYKQKGVKKFVSPNKKVKSKVEKFLNKFWKGL